MITNGDIGYMNSGTFQIQSSFLLIPSSNVFDLMMRVLDYYQRDYDILKESLGISNSDFVW